jgi:hypothetical protein
MSPTPPYFPFSFWRLNEMELNRDFSIGLCDSVNVSLELIKARNRVILSSVNAGI